MRLVEHGKPEEIQPLDRGTAFPQFYENGDLVDPLGNPFNWSYTFWYHQSHWSRMTRGSQSDKDSMFLMGCEL